MQLPPPPPLASEQGQLDDLSYDAGRIMAGEVLTHVFRVTNPSPETVRLADEGIVPSCGCSALVPAARELPPGGCTDVTVSIRTAGKSGLLSHGGTLFWTSSSGRKRTVSLAIRAVAIPPLLAEPQLLSFEQQDLDVGTEKVLTITPDSRIDASRLTVSSSLPNLELVCVAAGPSKTVYKVRCRRPEQELEDQEGVITISVPPAAPSPSPQQEPASITVPVHVRQALALVVQPKFLALHIDKSGKRASGRLMLRGAALGSAGRDRLIEAITCEGHQVEWSVKGTAGRSAILTITLTGAERVAEEGTVLIKARGVPPVRLPLFVTKHG